MGDPLDRYYTPAPLADAAWKAFEPFVGTAKQVFEPCCGAGAMGQAARRANPELHLRGCDIDPDAQPGFDWDLVPVNHWRPLPLGRSVIFTNPHYGLTKNIVKTHRALQRRLGSRAMGLLLRISTVQHLGSDPPHRIIFWRRRPTWEGPGGLLHGTNDSVGTALVVWLIHRSGPTECCWADWEGE